MKLLAKLNLFTVTVLLALTVSLVAVGYVIIGDIISSHNQRILAMEMDNLAAKADRAHRILLRAGVAHVAGYLVRIQQEFFADFQGYSFGRTGSLVILHGDEVAFGDRGQGRILALAVGVQAGEGRQSGFAEFAYQGSQRFAAYKVFAPWDWIMVLSISKQEMFEKRTEYLQRVSVIALGILALNWLATSLYVRRLVGRVRSSLSVLRHVGDGRLEERIGPIEAGDEIGDLQLGINTMISQIASRTEDRERAERELLASEAKYRSLFENSVDGIFQTTPEGRFLSVNPALARTLGFASPEDMLHCDVASTYAESRDRDRLLASLRDKGFVAGFECRMRRCDGAIIWVAINARAVRDENGVMVQVDGSSADITARKQAEEELASLNRHLEELVEHRTSDLARKAGELERANRRLRELDELKSAFLSSVSHELRTPLTSVLGFAKLIHKDFTNIFSPLAGGEAALERKAERILSNLVIIENEGERLTRLVNDVLDLSKIESGKVEWRDVEVAPAAVVDSGMEAVRGQFAQKPGLRLERRVDPDLPMLCADPDRLVQVIVNLLNNAAKFTLAGTVSVEAQAGPGQVEFLVSDTGIGVAEADRERIFEKFHQADAEDTLQGAPRGTGLGLTICREIVEHYGGRIWVESEPGKGSVFRFVMPCAPGPCRTGRALPEAGRAAGDDRRAERRPLVLVVDDEPSIRAYLTQLLWAEGYGVSAAADGPSALEAASRLRPDLITMDILMPDMDGRVVMGQLRRNPELRAIPILVITILQDREFLGGDAALGKPIDESRLIETIDSLLGRRESLQEVLVLRENGRQSLGSYFELGTGRIAHLSEAEIMARLEAGFQGTIVLTAGAAGAMDLTRLCAGAGVKVLILPDTSAPGPLDDEPQGGGPEIHGDEF